MKYWSLKSGHEFNNYLNFIIDHNIVAKYDNLEKFGGALESKLLVQSAVVYNVVKNRKLIKTEDLYFYLIILK